MSVREWLGKGVRVFAAYDWRREHGPIVKGEVIAVIDCPSIVVRTPDGRTETWPISLPMDEIRLDPPGCGCTGCVTGESVRKAGRPMTADRWIETDRGPARSPNCGPAEVGV